MASVRHLLTGLCCIVLALTVSQRTQAATGLPIGWGELHWNNDQIRALTNTTFVSWPSVFKGVALKADGTVQVLANNTDYLPPGLTNIIDVAGGGSHGLALRSDGALFAWGTQAGPPGAPTNIVEITAGTANNYALLTDGTIYGWAGTLGSERVTNAIAIYASADYGIAIRSDRTLQGWGVNSVRQLAIPAQATNVLKIAAGPFHVLALRADGTVIAWGDPEHGRIDVPVGLSNVVSIGAGTFHSVALKSDGTIVGWGNNDWGQLNVPTAYGPFSDVFTSPLGTMGLTASPFFLKHPVSTTTGAGENLSLVAEAVAYEGVAYQWFKNSVAIAGETNSTINFTNVQAGDSATYFVEARNASAAINSQAAELIVQARSPLIITQPAPFIDLLEGYDLSLSIQAKGTEPIRFAWKLNGNDLPGETNATLTVTNVNASHAGKYTVLVENSVASPVVGPYSVAVFERARIESPVASLQVPAGANLDFKVRTGGTPPLSHFWSSSSGMNMFPSSNSVFIRNLQAEDAGELHLLVTNRYGSATGLVARIEVIERAPEIAIQPQDRTFVPGGAAAVGVTALGTEPLSYQWFKEGRLIPAATNAGLVFSSLSVEALGSYHVVVSNRIGQTTSATAVISSNAVEEIDWPSVGLQPVLTNNAVMTDIAHAGDGSGRIFILELAGRIRIFRKGVGMATQPFLNITDRVLSGGERGLLGIAFHAEFKSNGVFYVYYTRRPDGATVVSRFRASDDPALADPATEQALLITPHPTQLHNGGQIAFGPDGYLYIAAGDTAVLPNSPAQATNSLLGKILRIDVSGNSTNYTIPPSNPYVGQADYRPEIWALGLRNPWRFDFDRLTGDLFIADVGERTFEEINFQPNGSVGGANYGWPIFEANLWTRVRATNTNHFVFPIASIPRTLSGALIGGIVHRGTPKDRLFGNYFSADYANGRMFALRRSGTNWVNSLVGEGGLPVTTFGEDEEGNLYVAQQPRFGAASDGIFRVSELFDSLRTLPPAFSPNARTFNSTQEVILNSPTPDAIIHYTLDGTEPTEASASVSSGDAITLDRTTTLKAVARRPGLMLSTITSGTYTAQLTLAFSPSGSLTNGTMMQILTSNGDAQVWFTLDGSTPTTNSTRYTGPFAVQGNQVIRAIGMSDGWVSAGPTDSFIGLLDYEPAVVQRIAGTGVAGTNDGPRGIGRLSAPLGVAVAPDGTVFVADSGSKRIRRVSIQGEITTLASGFLDPVGVAIDSNGKLFVSDRVADRVFQVTADGVVSPYAGSGTDGYVDGPGETAQFRFLSYLDIDYEGNLYAIDWGSIRRIAPDRTVSSFPASFPSYFGLTWSGTNLFTITPEGLAYKVVPSGNYDVYAGKLAFGEHSDGPALTAQFLNYSSVSSQLARDIISAPGGHLYLVDGPAIRHIHPDGHVTTLLESASYPSTNLTMYTTGIARHGSGSLYVTDVGNHSVFRISADTDRDTVPDPDESSPFVVGADDRLIDTDSDGVNNAAEYHAGTDPKVNAQHVLVQTSLNGENLLIDWSSERPVRIQESADLATWTDLTPPGSSATKPTSLLPTGTKRYFRLLIE